MRYSILTFENPWSVSFYGGMGGGVRSDFCNCVILILRHPQVWPKSLISLAASRGLIPDWIQPSVHLWLHARWNECSIKNVWSFPKCCGALCMPCLTPSWQKTVFQGFIPCISLSHVWKSENDIPVLQFCYLYGTVTFFALDILVLFPSSKI